MNKPLLLFAFVGMLLFANTSFCQSHNGHEYVDLGLPSSTKWAKCNIGAATEIDYGDDFAWVETKPGKEYYNIDSIKELLEYVDRDGFTHNIYPEDIAGTICDAATTNWGKGWRMPTVEQFYELMKECQWEWVSKNGVNGYKVTGTNGKYIFLPAVGDTGGSGSIYWSSSVNMMWGNGECLGFDSNDFYVGEPRANRRFVRAVYNDYAFVDLGLPSGLKWATCNIGAEEPEDYGNHYAWGETKTKEDYSEETYNYSDFQSTLPADFDVATVTMGSSWRMPTNEEMQELVDNCIWKLVNRNGVNGYKVTGKEGKYIFLPAAGFRGGTETYNVGSNGYYWSSSVDDSNFVRFLYFNMDDHYVYDHYRGYGLSVRAVRK